MNRNIIIAIIGSAVILGAGALTYGTTFAQAKFDESALSPEKRDNMKAHIEGMTMDIQIHYLSKRSINPEQVKLQATDANGSFEGFVTFKEDSRTKKETCSGRYDSQAKAFLWTCG